MGIQKIRTSPYQPSTNGCVQRFHCTLNSMFGKVVRHDQRNWDECLPTIMAAYRAAKHESTGFSSNRIVLGHENRAPLDLVLGDVLNEEDRPEEYGDFVYEKMQRMKECYTIAREHLREAARRRKDDYDMTVHPRMCAVGQWVWYYYPRRYLHRTPKWCKTYDGPFFITNVIPPCDYAIQKTARSTPITVDRDKLKICHGATPKSWLTDATQEVQHDARRQDERNDDGEARQSEVTETRRHEETSRQPELRRYRRRQGEVNYEDGEIEAQRVLPQRNRRTPLVSATIKCEAQRSCTGDLRSCRTRLWRPCSAGVYGVDKTPRRRQKTRVEIQLTGCVNEVEVLKKLLLLDHKHVWSLCCSYRKMKKTKVRQRVWNYKRCEECDVTILESNWTRHLLAHETYETGQVPRGRPRVRRERSQQRDIDGISLEEQAFIRRVARRLYALQNLGVPDYAQLAIVHQEFPTLTAHTRQVCQTMAKTILTAVKNKIRTALPYIICHSLGIGTGRASTEIMPATESSSMSLFSLSGQDTDMNIDISVPTQEEARLEDEVQPPEIQLLEIDANHNETLPQTPQLEASTTAPAVEKKEERIATTKYERKKRTERGRPTTYDSTELLPVPQLTRQQPKKQSDLDIPATQTVKVKSVAARHGDSKKNVSETTSTPETFESATSQKYVTPVDVQLKEQKERHRVQTSPWRSTALEYGRRDQRPRQHGRELRDHSPSSSRDRKILRRSRERSRLPESTHSRHGNQQNERDWRPPTMKQSDMDQFRREMLDEMRNMLQQAKETGAR